MFDHEQNTASVDGRPQKLNRALGLEKFSPVGRGPDLSEPLPMGLDLGCYLEKARSSLGRC